MKKLVYFLMTAVAISFAACGSNGGGGGGGVAAVPGVGGTALMGIASCQVGQVYNTTYGCLNQGSCPANYGYVPTTAQCIQGTLVTTQTLYGTIASVGRFYGTMSIVNQSQFSLLLKYAHLCDPYWVGWNFGSWNCDNWAGSGFVQLQYFGGSTAATSNTTMFIGAGSSGYGGNYSYSSSNIGFSQQARLSPANNSTGMYIDGVGPDGSSVGIKLVVNSGNLVTNASLTTFSADLFYQNVKFATVNFTRY